MRGNGKDIIRGGWGIYTDFGYTNSNVLFAAADASGKRLRPRCSTSTSPTGIRNPDGSFYRAGQPLSNIAEPEPGRRAGAFPLFGQWVDPRLQQPYQMQTNAGWSHELTRDTVVSVDYVNSLGRDLNFRPRVNQRIPGHDDRAGLGGCRADAQPEHQRQPSGGQPRRERVQRADPRRPPPPVARASTSRRRTRCRSGISTIGNAADELNTANIQDPNNPFDDPRQFGPNLTTDARHRVNVSGGRSGCRGGIRVAPFFFFRSALPVYLIDGRDLNLDGDITDIPTTAFRDGELRHGHRHTTRSSRSATARP